MRAHVVAAALTAIVLYVSTAASAVTDIQGKPADPFGAETAVLVFVRTDCPISNRYLPELSRIQRRFPAAAFHLIYVDPAQPRNEIERHVEAYGTSFTAVHDPRHELVKRAGVRVTPEAAVFRRGSLVYRGRIDDRYVDFGRRRSAATVHDLEQVLLDIAAGKSMKVRSTKAVGCFIGDLR